MLSQDSEDEIRSRFEFELAILLWQVELNPRVRCAFGNVYNETSGADLKAVHCGCMFSDVCYERDVLSAFFTVSLVLI